MLFMYASIAKATEYMYSIHTWTVTQVAERNSIFCYRWNTIEVSEDYKYIVC